MTAIITISLVLIVILCLLLKKRTGNEIINEENIKPKIMVSINGGEYRETKYDNSKKNRRERGTIRENRMIRKRKIWTVLRYMTTYKYLIKSSDFYSFKKNLTDYNYAKGELRKLHPDNYSFDAAIRFCRMENYYGTCDYLLTDDDVNFILNWQSNSIDVHDTLKKVLASYKRYWDGVLSSYVRPSARIKRLQHLIEDLENIMNLPYIQEHLDVLQGVKELQSQYQSQLNENTQ